MNRKIGNPVYLIQWKKIDYWVVIYKKPLFVISDRLENLEQMVVVRIQLNERTDYKVTRKVKGKLKNLDDTKVRFLEHGNPSLFGTSEMILLALPEAIDLIKGQFPDDVLVGMDIFNPKGLQLRPAGNLDQQKLIDLAVSLEDQTVSLETHSENLATLNANSNQYGSLSESEKVQLIKGLLRVLSELDQVHAFVHNFAMYETALADFKAGRRGFEYSLNSPNNQRHTESHSLQGLALAPIREVGQLGYEILDKVDHPIARQIIVETSGAIYGAGLNLLQGQPFGVGHSYFREWLDQQRENLSLVDLLPEHPDFEKLKELQLRISSHSGGIFRQIDVSGEMSNLSSTVRRPLDFAYKDTTERLPTILFGLPGNKEAIKRELVQYIIEADKKAQKLSDWSRAAAKTRGDSQIAEEFQVEGDDNLFTLIVGLTYIPSVGKYAMPNFSEVEYTKTIIEVFQQLLEIADTSLVNNGTYASVLEASSLVINEVTRKYGLANSKETELSKAAIQLQQVVYNRMITGLSWMSRGKENANACAILLSPNPSETMRKSN